MIPVDTCVTCGGTSWKVNGTSRRCRDCWNAWRRKHRATFPEKLAKESRTSAEMKAYNREHYKRNVVKRALQVKAYREAHPADYAANGARYRAAKLQATPLWSETALIKEYYRAARYLRMEVDHIIPLQSKTVCGLHCRSNLQLLPTSVNRSKSNAYKG